MSGFRIEEIGRIEPGDAFARLRVLPCPVVFARRTGRDGRLYTTIGAAPAAVIASFGDSTFTLDADGMRGRRLGPDPFASAGSALAGLLGTGCADALPFPFPCGLAGYFSYDLKDLVEPGLRLTHPPGADDPPLMVAGIYTSVYVYDHEGGRALLISSGTGDEGPRSLMLEALSSGRTAAEVCAPEAAPQYSSNTTRQEHVEAIRRALGYIADGDIYQINLSHRLRFSAPPDPYQVFESITRTSPAPYAAYMDLGRFQVISNSPERLLKVEGGWAETSPIKGTRPRGVTASEDASLVSELKASVKENAEHVMIVDLERNDIGRISLPGTVGVTEFERIETLPGLHHMVSTVRGRVAGGLAPLECLRAVFPGGSVTGTPKIRAIEIIDELEKERRGVYTGGIGWVDVAGRMDVAMAIRTAVATEGGLYLSVGGGIVADSDPEAEYAETILKARDFIAACSGDLSGAAG